MQLLIDIHRESRASLQFYASILLQLADRIEGIAAPSTESAAPASPPNQGFPQPPAPGNVVQFPGQPGAFAAPSSSGPMTTFPSVGNPFSGNAPFAGQPGAPGENASSAPPSFPNPNASTAGSSATFAPAGQHAASAGNPPASNAMGSPSNVPLGTLPPFAPGTEVDTNGYPHDVRIHSSGKTKTPAGAWRYKKGVADGLVASVEQELKLRMQGVPVAAAGAPPASAYAAPAGAQQQQSFPDPNANPNVFANNGGGGMPLPPAASNVQVQTQASGVLPVQQGATNGGVPGASAYPEVSFADLMQKQNRLAHGGRLSAEQFDWACKQAGAQSVTQLYQEPHRCGHVSFLIDQITGGG